MDLELDCVVYTTAFVRGRSVKRGFNPARGTRMPECGYCQQHARNTNRVSVGHWTSKDCLAVACLVLDGLPLGVVNNEHLDRPFFGL